MKAKEARSSIMSGKTTPEVCGVRCMAVHVAGSVVQDWPPWDVQGLVPRRCRGALCAKSAASATPEGTLICIPLGSEIASQGSCISALWGSMQRSVRAHGAPTQGTEGRPAWRGRGRGEVGDDETW